MPSSHLLVKFPLSVTYIHSPRLRCASVSLYLCTSHGLPKHPTKGFRRVSGKKRGPTEKTPGASSASTNSKR